MAKDDDKPGDKGGSYTPPESQADLDRIVEDRLKRERAKFADYDELKTKAGELDQLKADGKSGDEKLTEQIEKLNKDLAEERTLRLRTEVAAEKGLTPGQAKRLTGTTREELLDDADDLLEAFPAPPAKDDDEGAQGQGSGGGSGGGRPPATQRPKERLKAGTGTGDDDTPDPTADLKKLGASMFEGGS